MQSGYQLCEPPYSFQEKAFRFNNAAFGGDRYVCLKDQTESDSTYEVGLIDILEDLEVTRKTTRKADGAMKHPSENILALRGKLEDADLHFVQVFNLDNKDRLGEHSFDSEIVYWRWLASLYLVVVTRSSVFHWFLNGSSGPVKMFDRGGKLMDSDVQIISYCIDNEMNPGEAEWCLLAGIHLAPNDRKVILGSLQLFCVEKQQQQFLDGHSGCFGRLNLDDLSQEPLRYFSFAERKAGVSKLYVMDIYSQRGEGRPTPFKATCEFSCEATDLPIAQYHSSRFGLIFLVTKSGVAMIFDIKTAQRIISERISNDGVFVSVANRRSGGVLLLNRKGHLIHVRINEALLIAHVQKTQSDAALSLARRYGYPAAEDYLTQLFRHHIQNQNYKTAARIASISKGGSLRTQATINMFKTAPVTPGCNPIVEYFNALLEEAGRLTAFESVELMKPVVQQNRTNLPYKWLNEDKLECTEQLGDLVKNMDETLALKIYQRANTHQKVVQHFIERGQYNDILAYVQRKKYKADFTFLLKSMLTMDPANAVNFSKTLIENQLMDPDQVIDLFTQQNKLREISGVLIDILKDNKPEYGPLQTRLFELNLMHSPQEATALFEVFTQYDRQKVAHLCEKVEMYTRALEHYTDMNDIKRVISQGGNKISVDWLIQFCNGLKAEVCLEVLDDMLRGSRSNMRVVVQVAIRCYEKVGVDKLISLFENSGSMEGLYYFLGSLLAFTGDRDVHYKYIQCALKLKNYAEVERVIRESKNYDPVQARDLLMSVELDDPKPLIYVCDIHNFQDELTEYLYNKDLLNYIEVYVTKVNCTVAGNVIIRLLDLGCDEEFLKSLLNKLKSSCPLDPLIAAAESRHKLMLLKDWMEFLAFDEGLCNLTLNNALAKLYIDINKGLDRIRNYDYREIGNYCEDKDPTKAVAIYEAGKCDAEIIALCNKYHLYHLESDYLIKRRDAKIWALALNNEESKISLVEQVTQSLPDYSVEEISDTIKAFMGDATALLEILERIIFTTQLNTNVNLQNLLLTTSLRVDSEKFREYSMRLNHYDWNDVATMAVEQYSLYEEGLAIYKKNNAHLKVMETYLNKLDDLENAETYARQISDPKVFLLIAQKQLQVVTGHDPTPQQPSLTPEDVYARNKSLIQKSIANYSLAEQCKEIKKLIKVAEDYECYAELIVFFEKMKQAKALPPTEVDSEFAYCLAKTGQTSALQNLITNSCHVNAQIVGDRLYQEILAGEAEKHLYEPIILLYRKVNNNIRLTNCFLLLGDLENACSSAAKALNAKTWFDVAIAALEKQDFDIAHAAGKNLISHPDHLEKFIHHHEANQQFDQLVKFLESSSLGTSNVGVLTELGIAYAKYNPLKLSTYIDRLKTMSTRINLPKIVKICQAELLSNETVQLYLVYNEYDQAAQVLLAHSAVTWEHEPFVEILRNVTNTDIIYKAVTFYLEEQPSSLNDFLEAVTAKLEYYRVIHTIKSHPLTREAKCTAISPIALVVPWLESQQAKANATTNLVNEILNEIYLENYDYHALKKSVESFANFNQTALAQILENHKVNKLIASTSSHQNTTFNELALILYERNGNHSHALGLAKTFKRYTQAITIAYTSKDTQVAEDLLSYFALTRKSKNLFTACLLACHAFVKADVALELGWIAGYSEEIMPFVIQFVKDLSTRTETLEKQVVKLTQQLTKDTKQTANELGLFGMGGVPMLPQSPFSFNSSAAHL